ncbi:MAG: inositol monophosphatase family protein [Candidatus Helarchaeota archaeon]
MNEFLDFTIRISKKAGSLLMNYYNSGDISIKYKKDNSIVSLADIESEKLIKSEIKKKFPDHAIIGEEEGIVEGNSEYTWIIDPLDGTTNFSIHYPFFCVSIALFKNQSPIIGVIYFPPQDELFYAKRGYGAFLNNAELKVSNENSIEKSIIAFSNSRDVDKIRLISDIHLKFRLLRQKLRHFGSAALELSYLASGRISAFLSVGTNIWDVAAGVLLVQEAGGKVTDLSGQDYDFYDPNKILIASNGKIHIKLLNLLNKFILDRKSQL